jgi:hypothetical protein
MRNFICLSRELQSFQRFWGMGELSIHRWKGFELYPVINKKTVTVNVECQTKGVYWESRQFELLSS